jgi:hypothetical protein
MVLKTNIEPFALKIDLLVNRTISPAAQSKAFASFAKAGIAIGDAANQRAFGASVPRKVSVDGRQGAALESVKPDGIIVAEWDTSSNAVNWIWDQLRQRSPVLSGRYRRGHKLFADGAEVSLGAAIPPAREYLFVNEEPYSHKIEIGKTESGRDFEIIVPNRIYERVADDASKQFGGLMSIVFDDSGKSPTITIRPNG